MKYLEVSMDLVDKDHIPYEHYGMKRILVTPPTLHTAQSIQSVFAEPIKPDLQYANNQLNYACLHLFYTLPFLQHQGYSNFLDQPTAYQNENRRKHFALFTRPRTLEELSLKREMECSEHALAIKEVQFPDWDLFQFIRKDGTKSRHILLAHSFFDTDQIMIIDPTSKGRAAAFYGTSFIIHEEEFKSKYTKIELPDD